MKNVIIHLISVNCVNCIYNEIFLLEPLKSYLNVILTISKIHSSHLFMSFLYKKFLTSFLSL